MRAVYPYGGSDECPGAEQWEKAGYQVTHQPDGTQKVNQTIGMIRGVMVLYRSPTEAYNA